MRDFTRVDSPIPPGFLKRMAVVLAISVCTMSPLAAADSGKPASSSDQKVQAPRKADSDALKLVDFFLKTPTAELPPGAVGAFLAVEPETLPAKLRGRYRAKKEELLALKKISDGRKKPPIRRLNMEPLPTNSCRPEGPRMAHVLGLAGYAQIREDDEQYLMDKTKCSECELIAEFTLHVVEREPAKKGGQPKLSYFLHEKDPLQNLVAAHHAGIKNPFGTNFFGIGNPSCR